MGNAQKLRLVDLGKVQGIFPGREVSSLGDQVTDLACCPRSEGVTRLIGYVHILE